ncbi:MAG: TonB-dependent receptor [Holophagales bacterium]|nr:TonB-dependent receptor [Holophagales bacterium]
MKLLRFTALLVVAILVAGVAFAQGNPTGTLTGRVLNEGQGLPGVTVTVKSPSLMGSRTAVTSINGDFILPQLPAGDYTTTFTMSGFQTVTRQVKLSAAQTTPVQITMGLASIAAEVAVVAQRETISQTQQNATTVTSEQLGKLPTGRNIASAVALAPGTSNTGPSGNTVIGGAMSFENLYLVNGVAVQDNIRNTPYNLFIEDAIQEQTVSTSGISAEYGRFTGGVVNVITKSGGNVFSGSLRTTFDNDKWTKKTDYVSPTTGQNTEVKVDKINPTYEATVGGPIFKDTLWFFLAGRALETEASRNTATPVSAAYIFNPDEQRYEAKLTASLGGRHTILGNYQQIDRVETNSSFGTIYDLESLYDRELPQKLYSLNYSGTLSDNIFLEGQYSQRQFSFVGSGSTYTDLIFGTLMVNNANGRRWWSPTFCGVCDDEKRDANQALLKGTYFLSTKGLGSHNIVLGGEMYDDQRFSNNHQSGSDYRIYTTDVVVRNGVVYPVVNTTAAGNSLSFIRWTPILQGTQGNSFKTWSVFLNDNWTLNRSLSFNIGVRWDKNDGQDGAGRKTVSGDAISPRLGMTWDVKADGDMLVNASYARYVAGINNSQGDASSLGGQPATVDFDYRGPTFNLDPNATTLVSTEDVIRQVFAWFQANGGTSRPIRGTPTIPGINPNIEGGLSSPNTDEFSVGMTKRLGTRGLVRGDVVYRTWNDFYANRVDLGTGTVSGSLAGVTRTFDKQLIVNTSEEEREYWGFTLSASFRPVDGLQLQGNWTWSRLRGTFDGENAASGSLQSVAPFYPEYRDASWSRPVGDLAADQRHKVRLWAIYDLPLGIDWMQSSVSVLQNYDTGLPYGAVGAVDTRPYVTNPGYLAPPSTATYYFSARDAFRTDDVWRTDLSLNLSFRPVGSLEVFVAPQVTNVFNQQAIAGNTANITTTIETRQNNSASYAAFNPFTTAPTQGPRGSGANWNYSSTFGQPIGPAAYQNPRTFRFSVGLRF